MNAADLRALRGPLILLALVIAASVAAPYFTNLRLANAKRDAAAQLGRLNEARTRLQRSGDEKEVIVRYLGEYQQLQRLGFVGEEQRINWLDGLRVANQQAQLFGVDYQLGVQQSYPYAQELNPGQMALYESVMKISFRLLHEEDLMRFLGALARQGVGVFSVNECLLERTGGAGSVRFQPNLRASCELSWITMRPAPTGDKKS